MKNIKQFENKVLQGDCIEVMKTMPENSVDTIITDPPYELNFMGKGWDNQGVAFEKETWKEVLRVAKPGATLMAFGGTRTYHRLACAIEDAGWIIKDCIMWLYGSGFPKATDISKQLDKRVERRVVGKLKNPCGSGGDVMKTNLCQSENITEPSTPEAKLWNGWKSHGLKPSYEPILVAQKPNEGTYAANALKWGVSGLNIDGGRIGFKDDADEQESKGKNQHSKYPNSVVRNAAKNGIYQPDNRPPEDYKAKGRFPANILLDEEAGKMLDEQSGVLKSGSKPGHKGKSLIGDTGGKTKTQGIINAYGDKGGASRFFYVAKASKSERNLGCEGLEENKQ